MSEVLRIANCSGFYGDRFSAAREMVEGGDIDVLTGDYLAELTMFILSKARAAGRPGYATTFLRQMEEVLGTCLERGIRVVTNAGGLEPAALAHELDALGRRLGLPLKTAHLTGDDLMPHLPQLRAEGADFRNLDTGRLLADADADPFTANAYLGGRGIAQALGAGADIVVCPRVTDASLVVGPAMWRFGWAEDDYDKLAGAVAAGHVIECGAQATGGNYAFFEETDTSALPGFPLAEIHADGSSVITKHAGTGGAVTVGTVTAQLLYEVGGTDYLNSDVTLKLDTVQLSQEAPDRVRLWGTRGAPPPETLKVAMTLPGPYRQSVVLAVPGETIEAKAARAERDLATALGGFEQFDSVDMRLVRSDQAAAETGELGTAQLVLSFASAEKEKLGRRIFDAATGLALSSFPGIHFPGERQQRPTQTGVNWPCLVPASAVAEFVHLDGDDLPVPPRKLHAKAAPSPSTDENGLPTPKPTTPQDTSTRRVSLGTLFGARSGDKGAHANVGIWARSDQAYGWLVGSLTVEAFRALLPEAADARITRSVFPHLRGVNFVVEGLLGAGAAAAARFDPQAKGLAEFIRSREVELPVDLLEAPRSEEEVQR
ncbi:acyclic terpene utilization AtuA family protein [Streptomyces sp. NPDC002790]|uniref:acyclic terpene utilization AtuA family protein n=1 Tax=Streptomyces sp. NPDC002790 TaxID=3154431 RepID=UPI003333E31B